AANFEDRLLLALVKVRSASVISARFREGRADQLIEPAPAQPDHPGHLCHRDSGFQSVIHCTALLQQLDGSATEFRYDSGGSSIHAGDRERSIDAYSGHPS